MLRYRQTHDFLHVLTGLEEITIESELALKCFEFSQTGLPVTILSGLLGPLRLSQERRDILRDNMVPWAIQCGARSQFMLNVMYEDEFNQDLSNLQKKMGIYTL